MGEFCFNHFPAKLSFTPWSPEPSECLPVNLEDQIYSLCRKVNTHIQTQQYIYFIHLNMKYTFYRCFTRFPSVHGSPKMCVPKGHLPWARVELVKNMSMVTRGSICMLATRASAAELSVLQGGITQDRYTFHEKQNRSWTQRPLQPSRPGIYLIQHSNLNQAFFPLH